MAKGADTRKRILDVAQGSVLEKGFGATSIEEIIAATGLTKSGFFYHFRDKTELAKALLHRYIEEEERLFDEVFARANALADEPLSALLLGLKLLAELFTDLPRGHPGCLVALSCYHERVFNRDIQELNRHAALLWRQRFRTMFQAIMVDHLPREPVSADDLADMVSTVLEGAIVMSKALREPDSMARQILVLRSLLKLVFTAPRPAPLPMEAARA
jgi:AcrR family transcriptional regulator